MSKLRIQLLVGTGLVAIVSFAGTSTAWASVRGEGFGSGATALAAQHAATQDLHSTYFGCTTPILVFDNQGSDGTWSAEVTATCQGIN